MAVRSPFGSYFARIYALVAVATALIAIYRAGLYLLPAGAWAISLAVAGLGLVAPLVLAPSVRDPLLTGKLPLALVIPFVGLLMTPRLLPSPLSIGPFLFCAGALVGTCVVASVNGRHRRRRLRPALAAGDRDSFMKAYFEKGPSRPPLRSLGAAGLDAERDWVAAVDFLVRRHHIAVPSWFRSYRRALARSPLTPRDVAPTRTFTPGLVRPVTAGIAVVVLASVLLSTATAQTPVSDARPLPVEMGPRQESHVEPRLSAVLSALAGHRSQARCWSRTDWQRLSRQRSTWPRHGRRLGPWSAYASPAHDEAQFSPTLCAVLSRVAYQDIPAWSDVWPNALAFSVATLSHEAQHLRGILNEAQAECYGLQTITRTAELLGRSRAEGRYLAELYWRDEYPDIRDSAYRSKECRDGGKLDLHPASNVWP